jgi:hypothetical protein
MKPRDQARSGAFGWVCLGVAAWLEATGALAPRAGDFVRRTALAGLELAGAAARRALAAVL